MKTSFSTTWKNSKQPRKQRKYRYNAPLHIKKKFLGGHLSKELRSQYKTRTVGIKKGDKVKVMRGKHKGKTGIVERVSVQHTKIYIQGLDFKKRDGSKSLYPLEPSNLMITELNTEDKKRFKTTTTKKPETKVETKSTAKPVTKENKEKENGKKPLKENSNK